MESLNRQYFLYLLWLLLWLLYPKDSIALSESQTLMVVVLDPAVWSAILIDIACPGLLTPALFETATNKEPAMRKRQASLYPSSERPALPVLPAQSRFLARPNC
jgi:hypothetical protein